MTRFGTIFVATAALFLSAAAAANPQDGLNGTEVTDLILAALGEAGLSGQPQVSEHRHFPACGTNPDVMPKGNDWRTVTLHCNTDASWQRSIRLPGMTVAPADQHSRDLTGPMITAVALTESLQRGTVLQRQHLALTETSAATSDTLFIEPNTLIGRKLRINLGAGNIIQPRHLEMSWMIEKGTPVAITSSIPGLAVEMAGLAMESGQYGDIIEVQNKGSGRVIKAIVHDRNKVRVRPNMN